VDSTSLFLAIAIFLPLPNKFPASALALEPFFSLDRSLGGRKRFGQLMDFSCLEKDPDFAAV
jgi:hypothetical protein